MLLVHERLQAFLQIIAHHALQGVAVEADDVRQYFRSENRIALLFLLADDLQQNAARDVGVGASVDNMKLGTLQHQLLDILKGDVAADGRIVEPAIRVFFDGAEFAHGGHIKKAARRGTGRKASAARFRAQRK